MDIIFYRHIADFAAAAYLRRSSERVIYAAVKHNSVPCSLSPVQRERQDGGFPLAVEIVETARGNIVEHPVLPHVQRDSLLSLLSCESVL